MAGSPPKGSDSWSPEQVRTAAWDLGYANEAPVLPGWLVALGKQHGVDVMGPFIRGRVTSPPSAPGARLRSGRKPGAPPTLRQQLITQYAHGDCHTLTLVMLDLAAEHGLDVVPWVLNDVGVGGRRYDSDVAHSACSFPGLPDGHLLDAYGVCTRDEIIGHYQFAYPEKAYWSRADRKHIAALSDVYPTEEATEAARAKVRPFALQLLVEAGLVPVPDARCVCRNRRPRDGERCEAGRPEPTCACQQPVVERMQVREGVRKVRRGLAVAQHGLRTAEDVTVAAIPLLVPALAPAAPFLPTLVRGRRRLENALARPGERVLDRFTGVPMRAAPPGLTYAWDDDHGASVKDDTGTYVGDLEIQIVPWRQLVTPDLSQQLGRHVGRGFHQVAVVRESYVRTGVRGTGVGLALYHRTLRELARKGIPLATGGCLGEDVSESAVRIWDKLRGSSQLVRMVEVPGSRPLQAVAFWVGPERADGESMKVQGEAPYREHLVWYDALSFDEMGEPGYYERKARAMIRECPWPGFTQLLGICLDETDPDDPEVVGVMSDDGTGELLFLTDPEHQGEGIAKGLVELLLPEVDLATYEEVASGEWSPPYSATAGSEAGAGFLHSLTNSLGWKVLALIDWSGYHDEREMMRSELVGQGGGERMQAAGHARTGRDYFTPRALADADAEAAGRSRTVIVSMHPSQFLQLALPGEDARKQMGVEEVLARGEQFHDVPRLFVHVNGTAGTAEVTGHEGRHRARALLARGVTEMPVQIRCVSGDPDTIRWSTVPRARWPHTFVSEGPERYRVSFPRP